MKYNRDYDLRERILFNQPFDKDNNAHFNEEYKASQERGDSVAEQSSIFSKYYVGGCRRFDKITVNQLKELLDANFIDGSQSQNGSPTVNEFLKFGMKMQCSDKYTLVYYEGYAISPDRDDYRVSIDGIKFESEYVIDREVLSAFWKFIQYASEVEISDTRGRGWWD